jgi:hypothetical protein
MEVGRPTPGRLTASTRDRGFSSRRKPSTTQQSGMDELKQPNISSADNLSMINGLRQHIRNQCRPSAARPANKIQSKKKECVERTVGAKVHLVNTKFQHF